MGKRDYTIGTGGNIPKTGRPKKYPIDRPREEGWHVEINSSNPAATLSTDLLRKTVLLLNGKTGPEIKQLLAAISVTAKEHRAANRIEQAEAIEAHIPAIRLYLTAALPKLLAEKRREFNVQ